eukprot:gene2473-10450_t
MREDWNAQSTPTGDGPMVLKMKALTSKVTEGWKTLTSTKGKKTTEDGLADLTGEQYLKESKTKKITLKIEDGVGLGFEVMYRQGQRGVVACNVTRGGAAEKAGVLPGFIIVSVNSCNALGVGVDAVRTRTILLTVASPLLDMNGGNGEIPLEERQTGTLAKAPSYVNIKQTLIKEFGEEAFARSKKEVQTRMAAIAQEVEPWYEQPKELTKQEIIMEQMEAHAAVASEKMKQAGEVASEKMKQAGKWLSGMRKECEEAAGDLSNAIAGSNSGDGGIAPKTAEELAEEKKATELQNATFDSELQAKVKAFASGMEEPPLVCQSVFGSGTGISLSYAGVRSFLITEYGEETFARNKSWVRRELQTIEASSKPAVTIGDILAGGGSA